MVMMGKRPNIGVDLPSFVAVVMVSISVLCSPWPIVRSTNAQTDLDFVVVLRSPVATSSAPTVLSVYQGTRDLNLRTVSFDKAVLVGSPNDPLTQRYQFRNNNPRVPNGAIRGSDPATLTLPATMTTGARTGVYTVTVSEGAGQELGVKVLVTNEDAVIRAESYSTVVSRGDHFLLYVLRDETIPLSNLRWLMDGIPEGQPFTVCQGGQRCGENSAMNTTVYECYSEVSTYATQHHAIMNLIVRDCPHNMWGPPDCTGLCEPCINGGICSDSTGLCLCPPGFSGDGCQMVHGRNVFGQNAEYKCDDSGDDHADGCQGAIICYPDPLGCFCPAGYKGLNCSEECETGNFGANCKQECHCADNSLCALDTGVCGNNQCEDGWRGTNCQLVDPCPVGVYGVFCNLPCSCSSGGDACSEVEANCANGCAVPWTGIACDQDSGPGSIVSFDQIRGNPGQLYIVSCSAVSNPVIDSSSLQLNILAPRPESSVDERAYLTTNTWHLPYTTTPIGCAFQTTGHFEYQQFSLLPPFILPVYANPSNVLNFSDVTSTSITVSWPAWNHEMDIGDGPLIDNRIQYQEEGTTETFMEVKKGGGLSHQFTGLQPDTQYEFRIVLVREGQGGEGSPSNTQRQRTLCQAPGLPALAVVPSSRSASFDIMILSEDRRCSSVMVELQTWTGVTWIILRQLSSTTSAETIFSLIPCTHHRYRLQVANNAGTQTSEITDFTTQTEALASVSGFQVISVLPGQLEVIWEPNDLSLNNCSVVSYSVIYQFLSYLACPTAALTDVEIGEVMTNRNTISISKLRSYARYLVTVRANGDINGPENSREALTQESVAAAPPENVVVERDSSTDLEFRWDPPPCESQNGVITNYSYQLLQCNKTITEGTTESQGVVLVDLIPFTEYSFMVAASTSEGSGPASDAIVVTTEEDVPPQLPPPSTSFTTLTTILLSWVRPDPPHGIITGYDISFKVADEISSLQTVGLDVAEIIPENQPSYTLNNLKPVTIYSVMVRATTRLGPGMWSLPTLIITVDSLPGPPRNLNVTEMTETTLIIEWDGPSQPTWEIIKYQLRFRVVERFYQSQFVPEEFGPVVEISNPRAHNVHLISGLEPSTVYEIELSAFTEAGQGEVTMLRGRTDLVTDLEPVSISTVSRNVETATMILPPLTQAYSTGYYIRVKSTLVQEKMKRNIGGVGNYDDNPDEYIAAEIVKSEEEQSFTVGDGKEYGIYYNAPLRQDQEYQVFIGTGSKVGQVSISEFDL